MNEFFLQLPGSKAWEAEIVNILRLQNQDVASVFVPTSKTTGPSDAAACIADKLRDRKKSSNPPNFLTSLMVFNHSSLKEEETCSLHAVPAWSTPFPTSYHDLCITQGRSPLSVCSPWIATQIFISHPSIGGYSLVYFKLDVDSSPSVDLECPG
jgi:hypothetical protein